MIEPFCIYQRGLLLHKFRKRKSVGFYRHCHRVPGIETAENIKKFLRIRPVPAAQVIAIIKILPDGKFFAPCCF